MGGYSMWGEFINEWDYWDMNGKHVSYILCDERMDLNEVILIKMN